jgi:DNA repair exonuclease SbcCD ATPase subunit
MDNQQLHERLQELHSELQRIDSLDENGARVLRQLSDDIQELLDHSREHAEHKYKTLGERLRNGIDLLEASHPEVTMLMGQAADVLAKMGI